MSANYMKVKRYYEQKLWTIEMVRAVVGKKNGITASEFKRITGEDF